MLIKEIMNMVIYIIFCREVCVESYICILGDGFMYKVFLYKVLWGLLLFKSFFSYWYLCVY